MARGSIAFDLFLVSHSAPLTRHINRRFHFTPSRNVSLFRFILAIGRFFFPLLPLSAFSEEMLRGIFNCIFLIVRRRVDEKIAIRNQATSFSFLIFPTFALGLARSLTPTSDLSRRCDCRLEKLEIIDFVCWFFFFRCGLWRWRYGSSWHPSNH